MYSKQKLKFAYHGGRSQSNRIRLQVLCGKLRQHGEQKKLRNYQDRLKAKVHHSLQPLNGKADRTGINKDRTFIIIMIRRIHGWKLNQSDCSLFSICLRVIKRNLTKKAINRLVIPHLHNSGGNSLQLVLRKNMFRNIQSNSVSWKVSAV